MESFISKRVTHRYVQTNQARPEVVFPLLCPVREAEWAPGWKYRMIYSASGVAEPGCVFATPNEDGTETTWMVTEYDPRELRIAFAWVRAGMVATQIRIALTESQDGKTLTDITYTYTGLSRAGNELVAKYTEEWFADMMRQWKKSINDYLRNQVHLARLG